MRGARYIQCPLSAESAKFTYIITHLSFIGTSHSVSQNAIEPSSINQSVFVTAVTGNATIPNTQNHIASTSDSAYAGGDLASINTSRIRGGRSSSTRVVINTNADTAAKSNIESLNSHR